METPGPERLGLTFSFLAHQLLLPQQKAVAVGALLQVHGLGGVGNAAALGYDGQDGHLPPDVTGFALAVSDQKSHRVTALLHLSRKHTCDI